MPPKGKGKEVAPEEQPKQPPKMSASTLIKGHQNMMTWEVAGWHGGATLYHPEGCEKCDEYITHVVEAVSLNHINVSARNVEQALKVTWPDIIWDIEWDASAGPHEDCENLQDKVDDLRRQLSDANKASIVNKIKQLTTKVS